MFKKFKDEFVIPKKQYDENVMQNKGKANEQLICCIVKIEILVVAAIFIYLLFFNKHKEIYLIIAIIYVLIFLILSILYFVTYLKCKKSNYLFYVLLMFTLVPLYPISILNIKYEKTFKLLNTDVLDTMFFLILAIISSISLPFLCLLFQWLIFTLFSVKIPIYINVLCFMIVLFILKYIVIKNYIEKHLNIDNIDQSKQAFIITCAYIVVEFIFFILIFQILAYNTGILNDEIFYYIDKFYLIYSCIWLFDSVITKLN